MGKKVGGTAFLVLALLSFFGLAIEALLAFFIEPLFFGKAISDYSSTENIIHWTLTCLVWVAFAFGLIKFSKVKFDFNPISFHERIAAVRYIACFLLLGLTVAIGLRDWNGFKVAIEYNHLGLTQFIFQYLYYVCEAALVLLVVIFGQQAGERYFHNARIPWGGILAGLTWGLIHMLSKGDILLGLLACLAAVLYGVTYLVLRKNFWISYVFIFLMFTL